MSERQLKSPKHLVVMEMQNLYYSLASTRTFFGEQTLQKIRNPQTRDFFRQSTRLIEAAHHCVRCAFEDLGEIPEERICLLLPGLELETQSALHGTQELGKPGVAIILRGLVKACLYLQATATLTAQLAATCGYRDAYELCSEVHELVEEVLDEGEERLLEELLICQVNDELELAQ